MLNNQLIQIPVACLKGLLQTSLFGLPVLYVITAGQSPANERNYKVGVTLVIGFAVFSPNENYLNKRQEQKVQKNIKHSNTHPRSTLIAFFLLCSNTKNIIQLFFCLFYSSLEENSKSKCIFLSHVCVCVTYDIYMCTVPKNINPFSLYFASETIKCWYMYKDQTRFICTAFYFGIAFSQRS